MTSLSKSSELCAYTSFYYKDNSVFFFSLLCIFMCCFLRCPQVLENICLFTLV